MPKGECAMPMGTPCHSEERSDEESLALSQPRGQILRFAQNDKGGSTQHDKGVGAECQRGNAQCQWVLPVILRNEVTKNLSLCLSREGSFFAALRMTRGGVLRMTRGEYSA